MRAALCKTVSFLLCHRGTIFLPVSELSVGKDIKETKSWLFMWRNWGVFSPQKQSHSSDTISTEKGQTQKEELNAEGQITIDVCVIRWNNYRTDWAKFASSKDVQKTPITYLFLIPICVRVRDNILYPKAGPQTTQYFSSWLQQSLQECTLFVLQGTVKALLACQLSLKEEKQQRQPVRKSFCDKTNYFFLWRQQLQLCNTKDFCLQTAKSVS